MRTVLVGLLCLAALGFVPLAAAPASAAGGRDLYVDPATGDDSGPGTRQHPWRTLDRVTAAHLRPGDQVHLARGQRQVGSLWIPEAGTAAAPIAIVPYGHGSRPVISDGQCVLVARTAAFVRISGIKVAHCGSGDWRAGMTIEGDHVRVDDVEATGNVVGIAIGSTAAHATVERSWIHDNDGFVVGPSCDDDYGAQGISVGGDFARITHNRIDGQRARSRDYGVDGSAIEIVGARHTTVDHNVARGNIGFSELGTDPGSGRRTADTVFAYNEITGSTDARRYRTCTNGPAFLVRQQGIIVRGAQTSWGPNRGTLLVHNSISLTGTGSRGFTCYAGCTRKVLEVRANVLAAAVPGWADTGVDGFGHSANVLGPRTSDAVPTWGSGRRMHRGDRYAAPRFADPAHGLQLAAGSPCVDAVAPDATWQTDLAGTRVPQNGRADIGAYELVP